MKRCFKLQYLFSAFIVFELWCIRTILKDASVKRIDSLQSIRVQKVVVDETVSFKEILTTVTPDLNVPVVIEKTREKVPEPSHKDLSPNQSNKKSTVPYLPYSNFSYPLDIDLQSMYNEFRTTGRLSHPVEAINPHNFSYLHLQRCKLQPENNISLIILVKSAVVNIHLRNAIRSTWGNVTRYRNINVVFMLGYNASKQSLVDQEAYDYGDIVQESFLDAYMNNTYKTIMTFNWAVEYCDQANHLLFIDDDHYLVLRNLLQYIKELPPNSSYMVGYINVNAPVVREITKKWYVSREDYPFKHWPPYLSGGAFMLSSDIARRFVFSFPYIRYIGIDDCYLGIVAKKLGIAPQHVDKFDMLTRRLLDDPSRFAYHNFKLKSSFKQAMDFLTKPRPKTKYVTFSSLHYIKHKSKYRRNIRKKRFMASNAHNNPH
ncbi:beta-1,3-galactosyltransferase brn-like [Pecten maximus]|uniref:beta-1,3-galactosyltransferase brn-like n=1 Tax=Pecten maximus TaxID=6579 RepID=UPI0014589D60|nr:beta-1,3-galactosyltransferase brn-like [Pecten maximus]